MITCAIKVLTDHPISVTAIYWTKPPHGGTIKVTYKVTGWQQQGLVLDCSQVY